MSLLLKSKVCELYLMYFLVVIILTRGGHMLLDKVRFLHRTNYDTRNGPRQKGGSSVRSV